MARTYVSSNRQSQSAGGNPIRRFAGRHQFNTPITLRSMVLEGVYDVVDIVKPTVDVADSEQSHSMKLPRARVPQSTGWVSQTELAD